MWNKSNKLFTELFDEAKKGAVKKLLVDGDATPEMVGTMLKSGVVSNLKRINNFLDDEGRASAQAAIIRHALEKSKFFRDDKKGSSPSAFANALNDEAIQRTVNVFFKGAEKKQLKGLQRLLEATWRAQESAVLTNTGQQGLSLMFVGSVIRDAMKTLMTGGTIGAAGKAYESKVMRNTLLRLANTEPGSEAERKFLNQIMPGTLAGIQTTRTAKQ
jgi:ribosomal protein L10